MSENNAKEPLDFEEVVPKPQREKDRYSNIRFFLEIVPVILLTIGVILRYQDSPYWRYALITGGLLAAVIYLLFSRFLLKAEKQNNYEVILSVASGIVMPMGMIGIVFQFMLWEGSEKLIQYSLYGAIALIFITILSFLFHIKDRQAARFHRSLLSRLLVFTAIVFSLMV